MSTDTGIGAIKLPNDAQLRGAIEEYVAAIALAARRRELISAAQASISEAEAEVERTHQRGAELGIVPTARRQAAKPGRVRQTGAGSVLARAIAAVNAGHTTSGDVAAAAGVSPTSAASALLDAVNRGELARTKDENGRWRYMPIRGEA